MKKLVLGALIGTLCFSSMSYAKEIKFNDLPTEHWAYESTMKLCERGILTGYEDGTFRPDNKLTRAEFSTLLVKYFDEELEEYSDSKKYTDVSEADWFYNYVQKANQYMITSGSNFYPTDIMKREDVAYAIAKILKLDNNTPDMKVLDMFNDKDKITDYLKTYLALAVEQGYMSGKGDNFDPQAGLTRAEICALFGKIDKKYEESSNYSKEIKELISLGIFDRDINIDNPITREEMAKIICKLSGFSQESADGYKNTNTGCSDVPVGTNYTGWINLAIKNEYLIPYKEDNQFKPKVKLSANETLVLVLKVLGRLEYVIEQGSYPTNVVTESVKLGILENVGKDIATELTYEDLGTIIYNSLNVKVGFMSGGKWHEDKMTLKEKYLNAQSIPTETILTSLTLSKSNIEMKQNEEATVLIEVGSRNSEVYFLCDDNLDVDCEFGNWSGNSIPLKILAEGASTGIITVGIEGTAITRKLEVKVTGSPAKIEVSKKKITIDKGDRKKVDVTVTSPNKFKIKFNNSNSSVVKCEWGEWSDGTIPLYMIGNRAGTSKILIYFSEGGNQDIQVTINVTVEDEEEEARKEAAEEREEARKEREEAYTKSQIEKLELRISSKKNEIQRLEKEMENVASETNVKVMTNSGWRYTYDVQAVERIREELEDARMELKELEIELEALK